MVSREQQLQLQLGCIVRRLPSQRLGNDWMFPAHATAKTTTGVLPGLPAQLPTLNPSTPAAISRHAAEAMDTLGMS